MWRLAAADGRGVPYHDDRARSVVVGATRDLGDGESVWFRVLLRGGPEGRPGDRLSRDRVVAEVRGFGRAQERCETVTGMYRGKGWVFVDAPREVVVPDPPLEPEEIIAGWPLVEWAEGVVGQFMVRP